MLENSIYSVISPEGCASILWKDSEKAAEASECLKLTAEDLLELKIIEKIIAESDMLIDGLRSQLLAAVQKYADMSPDELTEHRYNRFREIGSYSPRTE